MGVMHYYCLNMVLSFYLGSMISFLKVLGFLLEAFQRAAEMVQSVKCFLCKYEDLNSDPYCLS